MTVQRILAAAVATAFWAGCSRSEEPGRHTAGLPDVPAERPSQRPGERGEGERDRLPTFRLSIVGINDLHGHVERLPVYAGYLANLRAAGFKTIVVDAGDMFQGTLASNLGEGDAVVAAYNAMGVAAAAIGNHEFDFGPVGPDATAQRPGQDPQGAIKARAKQAAFPLLAANIVAADTKEPIDWSGVEPSVLVSRGMIKIGIIGATTLGTPRATIAPNFAGLEMTPLAPALEREARDLRERGAHVVVAAVHAGASCESFGAPDDLSSCALDDELTAAVRKLPPGLIDVVVAGHSHRAMAHRVNGTAIIQQYSYGRAFGRVDLHLQQRTLDVVEVVIHPPRDVCADKKPPCEPGDYEGAPVEADSGLVELLEPFMARAAEQETRPLGVTLAADVERSYDRESALGNLFSDALLARTPGADVALTNGGGLRASLPAGPLVYSELYEAMPFDNRVATIEMTVADLERAFAANFARSGGILAVAGVQVVGRCVDGTLAVDLYRAGAGEAPPPTDETDGAGDRAKKPRRGKRRPKRGARSVSPGPAPLADDEVLTVVTNDYVALRGDRFLGVVERRDGLIAFGEALVRDEIAAYLTERYAASSGAPAGDASDARVTDTSPSAAEADGGPAGARGAVDSAAAGRPTSVGRLDPGDLVATRRLVFPGRRPVRCDRAASPDTDGSGRAP